MKRLLSFAFLLAFSMNIFSVAAVETDPTEQPCGEWDDVSSTYLDVITDVCERGIMAGLGSSNFDGDAGISRAMAATVGSRIAMGPDNFNDLEDSNSFYIGQLQNYFTDVPPNDEWNNWLLKAMYYARTQHVMSGDSNSGGITTFRYNDDVTTAEILKILFEAADARDVLSDEVSSSVSYDGSPWYADVAQEYYAMGVINSYSADGDSGDYIQFYIYYDSSDSSKKNLIRLGLNDEISRQNVAFIVYEMIQHDMMADPNEDLQDDGSFYKSINW
jgi:hypothetical protein